MEILNQTPIMEIAKEYLGLAVVFGLTFVVSFIFMLTTRFATLRNNIATIVCILSMLISMVALGFSPRVDTGRKRYEVTLNDTVSANEIFEKYDIIEQRGKIWVIEDKETVE